MTISCATLPERSLRMSETSRSARRCASIASNWPSATARERRVLAVGGEQPRVVGVAGAEEGRAGDPADGWRVGLALVDEADPQAGRALGQVGQVLLAPVDRILQLAVAGEVDDRARGELVAVVALGAQLGVRVVERGAEFAAGGDEAAIGARDRDPQRVALARPDRHGVAQLAADALAVRAVVAGRRRDRVAVLADRARLRPAVAGAGLAGRRHAVGGDERGVVVRLAARQRSAVREDQRAAVEGGDVGQVVGGGRVARAARPGIRAEQLRVRVDLDRGRLRDVRRVGELEPEQRGAAAVGDEVGPAQVEPLGARQRVADEAAPAREARRRPDPLVVDPEPDAVGELERRRPDAAHLAGDVPAVGVAAAVLERDRVRPRARGDGAAVFETIRRRDLRRGVGGHRHEGQCDPPRECSRQPHASSPISPKAATPPMYARRPGREPLQ